MRQGHHGVWQALAAGPRAFSGEFTMTTKEAERERDAFKAGVLAGMASTGISVMIALLVVRWFGG